MLPSFQYDDGIHPYMDAASGGGMYDPHVPHRPLQMAHHSPHMNHAAAMHAGYHANHVSSAVTNHVMSPVVPDVHKRDKDAIYG